MAHTNAKVNFFFHGDSITIPVGAEIVYRLDDGPSVMRGVLEAFTATLARVGSTSSEPAVCISGVWTRSEKIVAVGTAKDGRLHQDRIPREVPA